MQDEKGNWRQVDRVEGGQAFDAAGVPIGSVNERPVFGYGRAPQVDTLAVRNLGQA